MNFLARKLVKILSTWELYLPNVGTSFTRTALLAKPQVQLSIIVKKSPHTNLPIARRLPLSVFVQLSIPICGGLPTSILSTQVYSRLFLSTSVYTFLSLSAFVYQRLFLSVSVYPRSPTFFYQRLPTLL